MTNEEAKRRLLDIERCTPIHTREDVRDFEALEMAIQTLSQEPCDDVISRDELLKAIDTWDKFGYTETGCFVREPKGDYVPYIHYDDVIKCIKALPSVTQKSETVTEFADRCRECGARYGKLLEQKSGKWERHYIRPNVYKDLLWYCSACGIGCGYNNAFMFDYCPNCGAKMESEDKE